MNEYIIYNGPNIFPIASFKVNIFDNAIITITGIQAKLTNFIPKQDKIIATINIALELM